MEIDDYVLFILMVEIKKVSINNIVIIQEKVILIVVFVLELYIWNVVDNEILKHNKVSFDIKMEN